MNCPAQTRSALIAFRISGFSIIWSSVRRRVGGHRFIFAQRHILVG